MLVRERMRSNPNVDQQESMGALKPLGAGVIDLREA
jgi:hypothetical protein